MASVTEMLLGVWENVPAAFAEKGVAIAFLKEDVNIEAKMKLALALLEEVAKASDCHETWKALVAERLQAAEKAMKFLLPRHRDHIIHSAHIYLLGVAIYFKMLRADPALAAVIADTHLRDVQAFFGPGDMPYSCFMRIINPAKSLVENRTAIGATYTLDFPKMMTVATPCLLCQPAYAVQMDTDSAIASLSDSALLMAQGVARIARFQGNLI